MLPRTPTIPHRITFRSSPSSFLLSLSAAAVAVFGVVVDMIKEDRPLDDDTIQSRLVLVVPLKLPEGEEDDDDGNALIDVTSFVAINKESRVMVAVNLLTSNLNVVCIELRLCYYSMRNVKTSLFRKS